VTGQSILAHCHSARPLTPVPFSFSISLLPLETPPVHPEDLPFRVIRVNSDDEVIARANNLLVGRAAYETAVRLYPGDTIQYRDGARIIARSDGELG
jgi:hypothetical protein